MDGKKPFLVSLALLMSSRGVLAIGDAKEMDRALSGEMRAGPRGERLVGPTLDADVSVKLRYHGFRESK